jgi:hypothetical protein
MWEDSRETSHPNFLPLLRPAGVGSGAVVQQTNRGTFTATGHTFGNFPKAKEVGERRRRPGKSGGKAGGFAEKGSPERFFCATAWLGGQPRNVTICNPGTFPAIDRISGNLPK